MMLSQTSCYSDLRFVMTDHMTNRISLGVFLLYWFMTVDFRKPFSFTELNHNCFIDSVTTLHGWEWCQTSFHVGISLRAKRNDYVSAVFLYLPQFFSLELILTTIQNSTRMSVRSTFFFKFRQNGGRFQDYFLQRRLCFQFRHQLSFFGIYLLQSAPWPAISCRGTSPKREAVAICKSLILKTLKTTVRTLTP